MKRGAAILVLTTVCTLVCSPAPAWCQAAKPAALASNSLPAPKAPRIPLNAIRELERTFNDRLTGLAGADQPTDLMGDTRGIQLEDYGVVFTTEISLVVTPGLMPGRPTIPPEMAARVKVMRVARLPVLREAMKGMMRDMAAAFPQLPAGQQLVLVARLYYAPWEDTSGMPAQIVMRANRANAALTKVETEER